MVLEQIKQRKLVLLHVMCPGPVTLALFNGNGKTYLIYKIDFPPLWRFYIYWDLIKEFTFLIGNQKYSLRFYYYELIIIKCFSHPKQKYKSKYIKECQLIYKNCKMLVS